MGNEKHMKRTMTASRLMRASTGLAAMALLTTQANAQSWSTATLSVARAPDAATAGNKALFAGGSDVMSTSDVVDIYEASSGTWTTDTLSAARFLMGTASVGSKALFAGGTDTGSLSDVVDIYDDWSGTWTTANLSLARFALQGTTVGTKALFAGGALSFSTFSDAVDIYDDATGTWSTATLSTPRRSVAATSVGSKAFFAGGWDGVPSDVVDIYDDSTGTWSTATLSVPRGFMSATSVGTLALFAGGEGAGNVFSDVVDIYDDSTGLWTTSSLSLARRDFGAVSVGSKAIFAGGLIFPLDSTNVVDIYDSATGTWTTDVLSTNRAIPAAASIGNQALFAGGIDFATFAASDVVDIYTDELISTTYCSPAVNNSTGGPATIGATGSNVASDDDVTLTVTGLPTNQFGYFLRGTMQGSSVNHLGSQGNLCLGGDLGRLNRSGEILNSGASGEYSLQLPLTNLPTSTGTESVMMGDTRTFQSWYRDRNPMPTSNFSDAVEITFR